MDVSVHYSAINQYKIIVILNHLMDLKKIGSCWPIKVSTYEWISHLKFNPSIHLFTDFYNKAARLGKMCVKFCATMGVYYGIPIVGDCGNLCDEKNRLAYIKLYFKTQITVRRSFLDYTSLSLFGEVGGYIGLLLGFSFFDLTFLAQKVILYISEKLFSKLHEQITFK